MYIIRLFLIEQKTLKCLDSLHSEAQSDVKEIRKQLVLMQKSKSELKKEMEETKTQILLDVTEKTRCEMWNTYKTNRYQHPEKKDYRWAQGFCG